VENQERAISPINRIVEEEYSFRKPVIISDCTLRDGEQQAGLVFSQEDKVMIAKALDELGIDEIESGMPAVSNEDLLAVKKIVDSNLNAKISALCRATKKDIDIAYEAGVWGASISLPIGDLQRKHKLKWSNDKYIDTCLSITDYARGKGMHVILSPYDTTRVELSFLDKLLDKLNQEGTVDRIRIVDTVGAIHPKGMHYLVQRVKQLCNFEIEVHCHDDFGLATANTIAALGAGADVASVTMNGIGERSGNTALEEVVTALEILYSAETNIDLHKLRQISKKIEKVSGIALQGHKPVVGDNSFRHESGMVVAGLLEEPFTAEAIRPEVVGQEREIVIGKGSGEKSLVHKLQVLDLDYKAVNLAMLLSRVKERSIREKRSLTDKDITELYQDCSLKEIKK
jgi:isopropylmalate/homocitrate/citramalate synthase